MTWLRAIVMTLTLSVVVVTMTRLKNQGLPEGVSALFGLDMSETSAVPSGPQRLTWCDTRVKALALSDGSVIEQNGNKWLRSSPPSKKEEIDFLAVEKWLGEHCSVEVVPKPDAESETWQTALEVTFIRGSKAAFLADTAGLLRWKDLTFSSEKMLDAISSLRDLPRATPRP